MKRFYEVDKKRNTGRNIKLEIATDQKIEIEENLKFDISDEDIYYFFGNLQIANSDKKDVFPIQDISLWQDKIRKYFPYLEEVERYAFKNKPYTLFVIEYVAFKEFAINNIEFESQELIESTFKWFLFALSGQLEKIAQANLLKEQEDILYMLAASNGHTLAFDKLSAADLAESLCFAASKGNCKSVELLLNAGFSDIELEKAFQSAVDYYLELGLLLFECLSEELQNKKENLVDLMYGCASEDCFELFEALTEKFNISEENQESAAKIVYDLARNNDNVRVQNIMLKRFLKNNLDIIDTLTARYHELTNALQQNVEEYNIEYQSLIMIQPVLHTQEKILDESKVMCKLSFF